MKKSHNFSLNYQNIIEQEVLEIGITNKRERKREREMTISQRTNISILND